MKQVRGNNSETAELQIPQNWVGRRWNKATTGATVKGSRDQLCQQQPPRAGGITSLPAAILPGRSRAMGMNPAAPRMHRQAIPPSLKMWVRGGIRGVTVGTAS